MTNTATASDCDAGETAQFPSPTDQCDVRELLIAVLTEIQEMGGNEMPVFDDDLCILTEVSEFDSLVAVEAESLLELRLDTPIPDNLFFDSRTGLPATLQRVVEQLCKLLGIPSDRSVA